MQILAIIHNGNSAATDFGVLWQGMEGLLEPVLHAYQDVIICVGYFDSV